MNASIARRGLLAAAAAISCLVFVPKAHAGLLVADATSCENPQLSQPFLPWLDPANYFALGNGFEDNAAGWTLTGGAGISGDQEPWMVSGPGSNSLELPAGASATSPVVCVGIDSPTIRFFGRRMGGGLLGATNLLKIDAIIQDANGNNVTVPVGTWAGSGSWAPSLQLPVLADLLPLLPNNYTPVEFKFTNVGTSSWHVDDPYVDPWHCC